MTRFTDWDWRKIGQIISTSAKLIRLSPTKVEFYAYPYGHIKIQENGGGVNISWGQIQGLELPIPVNIRIESFQLAFSIPYDLPGETETGFGLKIKTAIDNEIAEAIALKQYLNLPWDETGEIRVIELRPRSARTAIEERYLVQSRQDQTKSWKTESWHKEVKPAIEWALKLEENKKSQEVEKCSA